MFLPDNIDFTHSETYILSIRLTPNGFYFSIHCPTDKSVFYQNSVTFPTNTTYLKNIEKFIFDYSFFSYNFQEINVICVNNKFTLVPNEYYKKKLEEDLLSFNFSISNVKVMSNEIKQLNCRVIWGMDDSLHNFLSRTLLNPVFRNHGEVLISSFYRLHEKSETALYINFNENDMIDAIAFSGDKLTFAKTFTANSPLEGSYFIQKTWEILQLDAQSDKLFFSGKTDTYNNEIETLKKLIPTSKHLKQTLPADLNINQNEVPTEILFQLCEL